MYRFQIVNADNQILRFISVSGTITEARKSVSRKLKFLYGPNSCFLQAELVSESYYKNIKPMLRKDYPCQTIQKT